MSCLLLRMARMGSRMVSQPQVCMRHHLLGLLHRPLDMHNHTHQRLLATYRRQMDLRHHQMDLYNRHIHHQPWELLRHRWGSGTSSIRHFTTQVLACPTNTITTVPCHQLLRHISQCRLHRLALYPKSLCVSTIWLT